MRTRTYWGTRLAIAGIYMIAALPRSVLIGACYPLSRLAQIAAKRRGRIIEANLAACFPEWSDDQRREAVRENFRYTLQGGMETLMAWVWSSQRFDQIPYRYIGLEHLEAAIATGRGVMLCGAHFTCLELVGRIFGKTHAFDLVYQRHKNPVFEGWMSRCRHRYVRNLIDRYDIRSMVRTLRSGGILWYAPDQDMGRERSVFVDFFGVPAATVTATARLADMGKAWVIPVKFYFDECARQYILEVLPPFEPYPTGDEQHDAEIYTQCVEKSVSQHPMQYLWSHRRFKTRPEGSPRLY